MNKIVLIGNLTRDPELRTTPNGVSVCTFSIAVNRRFSSQGGEKMTDFFRITVWRQQGENCAKYLSKGKKVAVVGELQARTYEGNDGKTYLSLEVSADEVEFLTPKGESGGYAPYNGEEASSTRFAPQTSVNQQQAPSSDGFATIDDDDLPF